MAGGATAELGKIGTTRKGRRIGRNDPSRAASNPVRREAALAHEQHSANRDCREYNRQQRKTEQA